MKGFGNLGGAGGMGGMMKQAQKAMEQLQRMQEELAHAQVEGTAGGGAVTAVVNGLGAIQDVRINPDLVELDDLEMLQDLVISAVRNAQQNADREKEALTRQLTGGLPVPGNLF